MLPPLALNAWLRYDMICRMLSGVPRDSTLLEVGVGQGAVGARLAQRYRYTGVEPDPISAQIARPRIEAAGGRFMQGTVETLGPTERFQVVGAFEVLEHLDDDVAALRSWAARLVTGGMLLLTVPAFQSRFAAADEMAGHVRRYDPEVLIARLHDLGLIDIEVLTTGFPLGVVLEHGRNFLATFRPKTGTMADRTFSSGRVYQPPLALGWATATITLPFRWMQHSFVQTRFGTGLVARAIQPH